MPDGIAIDGGIGEGRQIDRRRDIPGEDAAIGRLQRQGLHLRHRDDQREGALGRLLHAHQRAEGGLVRAELCHRFSLSAAAGASTIGQRLGGCQGDIGDRGDIVQPDAPGGPASGKARSLAMATMLGSCGMQRRLAVGVPVDLDLGVRLALEALDDDEIDRREPAQQLVEATPRSRPAAHASAPSAARRRSAPRARRPRDGRRNPCRACRDRRRDGRA